MSRPPDPPAVVPQIDRSRLPEPGVVRGFRFPSIDKSQLANGLRVWTISHPSIPLTSLLLLIKRGAACRSARS